MQKYNEKALEDLIEAHLLQSGYTKRAPQDYDKDLCLDKNLLLDFFKRTQSQELKKLTERGEDTNSLLERLKAQMDKEGALKLLQEGIEHLGVKFSLAYNKPQSQKNPDTWKNYQNNVFSVVRQLRYSPKNNNSLDLVIFLNGLPLFTFELKHPLTGQSVEDAMRQYREDRNPHEPLFKHTLAHFALDSDLVYMTTKLEGKKTRFIPFNKGLNDGSGELGRECGASNPPNPQGLKSAYLWESVLQKDNLLNLLFNFLKPGAKPSDPIIFPRYHQLDVVKKLCDAVQEGGVGGRYLIQHSAGSGKSNSIAWLACTLVGLSVGEKVLFDSVLVITDRIILDDQLQKKIKAFCPIKGVVEAITKGSGQLKDAMSAGKKIIITTIQKFPYILEDIPNMRAKNFAIIIDEAHSSQGGKHAQSLSQATSEGVQECQDPEEFLLQAIQAKQFQPNASYFAFSATPKPQTLELFGTRVSKEAFIPFHLYSMKQAIEEGFILDVLQHYITYKSYAKLVSIILDDPRYDKPPAIKKLKSYVKNHPKSIWAKTQVMLEHFYSCTHAKIGGKAKAMVVTDSRQSALEYFKAFKAQLEQGKHPHKALVAFSGDVKSEGQIYNEAGLNGFSESQLPAHFEKDNYRFLIVADKYQTGFDQPLLHTMYVDKALSGVACVQTLSRLNRTHPDKIDTCILDFANNAQDIAKAFEPYYKQSVLTEPSDPNKLFDLKSHLDSYGVYLPEEVEAFNTALLNQAPLPDIHTMLDRMVQRYDEMGQDSQQEFYNKAKTYLKNYAFLVQILPFQDVSLEKLFRLLGHLIKKLAPLRGEISSMDITKVIALKECRLQVEQEVSIPLEGQGELHPSKADGSSKTPQSQLEKLSEILEAFHREYGIALDERDKQALNDVLNDMCSNLEFSENLKHSDPQNKIICLEDYFKKHGLPYLAQNNNLQLVKLYVENPDFKGFILPGFLKILEYRLENAEV
ncbi:type I restriction endonuclease subunit R [Helicobacter felis]|uniref:type I restriction endonuclease subunit R n=1 Tax=Helicobacter felis TaxID=214 RepID=UPI000CF09A86|nr:type I restriction endonuclease [Helicobacter felis]